MSLHPEPIFDVPELTATVAKAAFPKGNRYMKCKVTPIHGNYLMKNLKTQLKALPLITVGAKTYLSYAAVTDTVAALLFPIK